MGFIIFDGVERGEILKGFSMVIEHAYGREQSFNLFEYAVVGDSNRFVVGVVSWSEGELEDIFFCFFVSGRGSIVRSSRLNTGVILLDIVYFRLAFVGIGCS